MTEGKRPTIKDIAQESGYSKTAVSFAFNEPSRISVKARNQILGVADRLGYIPDPMARNFSLHKHMSVGFLLPQDVVHSLGNPYIGDVLEGIGSVCQKHGYTLTLIPPLEGSMIQAVRNAAVDGLIALGMKVGMDIVDILNTRKMPYVTIDGTPSAGMPSVNIRDMDAAYQLMDAVLAAGHKDIAIVSLSASAFSDGGAKEDSVPSKRIQGFEKAFSERWMDINDSRHVHQFVSECTFPDGVDIGRKIMAEDPLPTAVVTMSDIVAIGCMSAFHEKGINVPKDMSVVGFDNDIAAKFVHPALTTIDQPALEKGAMAAEALFRMIGGEHLGNMRMEIPFRLVKRESLATPRNT
ncbi:MAG: LacI family DNA-binding transcriptional regulator [Sphaerochaetaceae bacterium]|jgi:DNA-binding LacI/PurR family transcriptional regulator